jgi:hypothetical protein
MGCIACKAYRFSTGINSLSTFTSNKQFSQEVIQDLNPYFYLYTVNSVLFEKNPKPEKNFKKFRTRPHIQKMRAGSPHFEKHFASRAASTCRRHSLYMRCEGSSDGKRMASGEQEKGAAFCQTNPGSFYPWFTCFGGFGSPDRHGFAKNRHYYFARSPIRRQFGWIRNESGLEKTAFSIVWTGDRLTKWAEVG